ncbi:uncharacterized protein METZ01_LOCUS256940 [marine metagenome]|uniref:Uncharacterized protein n=1 Tax=marine metagenome TaxID=408172 RepID=A0A382IWT3_9ZZZZ
MSERSALRVNVWVKTPTKLHQLRFAGA